MKSHYIAILAAVLVLSATRFIFSESYGSSAQPQDSYIITCIGYENVPITYTQRVSHGCALICHSDYILNSVSGTNMISYDTGA